MNDNKSNHKLNVNISSTAVKLNQEPTTVQLHILLALPSKQYCTEPKHTVHIISNEAAQQQVLSSHSGSRSNSKHRNAQLLP